VHTQLHLRPESVKQVTKEQNSSLISSMRRLRRSVNQLLVVTLRRRCLVLK